MATACDPTHAAKVWENQRTALERRIAALQNKEKDTETLRQASAKCRPTETRTPRQDKRPGITGGQTERRQGTDVYRQEAPGRHPASR